MPDGDSAARSQLPEAGINLREYLSDIERRTIESALRESDGVVQAAADRLGVRRTTLVEKFKKFGISV